MEGRIDEQIPGEYDAGPGQAGLHSFADRKATRPISNLWSNGDYKSVV